MRKKFDVCQLYSSEKILGISAQRLWTAYYAFDFSFYQKQENLVGEKMITPVELQKMEESLPNFCLHAITFSLSESSESKRLKHGLLSYQTLLLCFFFPVLLSEVRRKAAQ